MLLQFLWWGWLLINLNNDIYDLKSSINLLQHENPAMVIEKGNELEHKLHLRWMMIVGEGVVFISLLLLGIMHVVKTQKKEAELGARQKNFLLSVTHELKSPIAGIKIATETLLKRELDKEKQTEILNRVLTDTDRLNQLVENILTAAKIDEGKHVFDLRDTDLTDLVTKLCKPYTNVKFIATETVFCKVDSLSFPSILNNLIDNAHKYAGSENEITVALKKENSAVILSVADNGAGIPDAEKEKVFEKFYRIGNEETRSAKGTGLGLYIVNYLVLRHGASIAIKNNKPKGCIFEIRFNK